MADLETLRTSLTELSRDELLDRIREIREDRRISKHAITHRVARAKQKKKTVEDKLAVLLKGMTPADIKALMEETE